MMGIYQIANIKTGKIYIGSSSNIVVRWNTHINDLYYRIHNNYKLQEDYNRFGLNSFSFSILEVVKNKKKLFEREQEYLDSIDIKNNYNILSYSNIENSIGIEEDYSIVDFKLTEKEIDLLKNNIKIIDNEKLNAIRDNKTDLSKSWYSKANKQLLMQLKNNIFNFYQTIVRHEKIYWTCFTFSKNYLESKGLIKRFVSLNDTPKEKCNNLTYPINNFTNPNIKRNTDMNDDEFALKVLLKWILNVSDISKPINVYIPSKRMRNLLSNWIKK